jgi:hypothetical protein
LGSAGIAPEVKSTVAANPLQPSDRHSVGFAGGRSDPIRFISRQPAVPRTGMTCHLVRYDYFLVFVADDPRDGGCLDPIKDDIWLDEAGLSEPIGGRIPAGLCAGVNPIDHHHFHLFRSPAERSRAGFHQVVGVPVVSRSWDAFLTAAADCGEPVAVGR